MQQNRLCDDWITDYLAFTEYNTEPPVLYRHWTAISVIAAALQRKVFLNWHDCLYPNMYICLVGPPACRKGTAMGPGYKLLVEKGIRMAAEATTRESLIRFLRESGTMDVDDQGTALIHASLTVFSQEFTVFLGYNNQTLMSDLTDWFDCRERWTYRTKNMGEDDIIGVFMNIIGATTPELIHSALPVDAVGSGLTSRMIFVYEEAKGPKCPAPFATSKHKDIRDRVSKDLSQIMLMRGEFKIASDFMDVWTEWYMCTSPSFEDIRFAGYFERRQLHLLKLSMIMSASRSNDMRITIGDFERARALLEVTERKMPMTFMGHGRNRDADLIPQIMALCGNSSTIRYSALMKHFYRDVDARGLEATVQSMRQMGLIRVDNSEADAVIHYIPRSERKML